MSKNDLPVCFGDCQAKCCSECLYKEACPHLANFRFVTSHPESADNSDPCEACLYEIECLKLNTLGHLNTGEIRTLLGKISFEEATKTWGKAEDASKEYRKAWTDSQIYGTGIVKHIPHEDVINHGTNDIDHPLYYTETGIPSGIECWDHYELALTEEEFIGAMKSNIYKYIFRAGRKYPKKGIEDLKKAAAYLNRWITYLEGKRVVWMKGEKNAKETS